MAKKFHITLNKACGADGRSSVRSRIVQAYIEDGSLILKRDDDTIISVPLSGDTSIEGVYNPAVPLSTEMAYELGGLVEGTTAEDLDGLTFSELFDLLLFQAEAPTYTAPTATLTSDAPSLIEVGTAYTGDFTATFTQNNGGTQTDYDLQRSASDLSTDNPYTENLTQSTPIVIPYQGIFAYAEGPILNDSQGNPFPTGQITAGTVTTNTINKEWIFPYFWGISASNVGIDYLAGTKVVEKSNTGITINFNATEQYLWFAVPATVANYSSWFITALNQGNIGTPSDLFNAPSIVALDNTIWDEDYKIYISSFVTTVNEPMQIS